MREALIVCPRHDNNDAPLVDERRALVRRLLNFFGGCTEMSARGHWKSPSGRVYSEPMVGVTVACEPTADNISELRATAAWLGWLTRQECIYLRLPNGEVEFVEPQQVQQEAA